MAKEMAPDSNYSSNLMFGIQWDLVCKFIEVKSELGKNDINSNSSRWGNYKDVLNTVSSDNAKRIDGSWKLVSKDEKI